MEKIRLETATYIVLGFDGIDVVITERFKNFEEALRYMYDLAIDARMYVEGYADGEFVTRPTYLTNHNKRGKPNGRTK